MKNIGFALMAVIVSFGALAAPVGPMNYQGRLLDNQGIPVTGSYNFVVKIFDDPVAGTLKYQETLSGIQVDDGVYSFKVGLGPKTGGDSLWDIALWQSNLNDLHLELSVNGEILTPRHELTSAPHAFTSTLALSAESLGAKTAAEFDNILEGVCVSTKGKWLDTFQRCAGGAIDLSNKLWSDLDPSNDYSGVIFDGASFVSADFSGVNFSGATFKNVDISNAVFTGANMTNVIWDGVVSSTPFTINFDMSGAQFKNMNMSNFTLINDDNFVLISSAYLTACPAALPVNFACRVQKTSPSTVYHLVGHGTKAGVGYFGINYAVGSALQTTKNGQAFIDVDNFNNTTVQFADFSNMYINQSFDGTYVDQNSFRNANINNVDFSKSFYTQALDFTGATLNYVNFSLAEGSMDITGTFFNDAQMNYVSFRGGYLESVAFVGAVISNCDFTGASDGGAGTDFSGAKIYNSSFRNPSVNNASYQFTNGLLKGEGPNGPRMFANHSLVWSDMTGTTLIDMVFDSNVSMSGGTFVNSVWINPTFNSVNASNANFTGAKFLELEPGALDGITNWSGATCPDGNNASAGANPSSCVDQLL